MVQTAISVGRFGRSNGKYMSEDTPTVLVVDDERDLADLYAAWLEADYRVRTAYGGDEAMAALDETVDVALIDRLMPAVSGDEVLEHVRREAYACRVSMVTAVEPDFDIIEMGFDDYLVKPVRRDELQETVESLRSRSTYDDQLREYFALASKRAALEAQKSERELAESESYAQLTQEFERLQSDIDQTVATMDADDFEATLRQLDDG
jgi:DNA-binding response OmpR family regulator